MPAKKTSDGSKTDSFASSYGTASGTSGEEGKTAEEIRDTVKEQVGKGVAAVAGVADGINEQMQETNLKESAEQAIRQVGETTHKVVRAAREEADNIRSAIKGEPAPTEGRLGQGSLSQGSGFQEEPASFTSPSSLASSESSLGLAGNAVEEEEEEE